MIPALAGRFAMSRLPGEEFGNPFERWYTNV